jgi:hypothetical protein
MVSLPDALQTALQHHQAGCLPEAEVIYLSKTISAKILAKNHGLFESLEVVREFERLFLKVSKA